MGSSRPTRSLAISLLVIGFVILLFGWNGAAGKATIPEQFPYLISGGLTGLSSVVIGSALMIIDEMRTLAAKREGELVKQMAREAGQRAGADREQTVSA